jgi:cytochrome d ubiquinol oxidase subunit II
MITFFVLNTGVVAWTVLTHELIAERYLAQPLWALFPALALGAVLLAGYMVHRGHYFIAFLLSSAMIAGLLFSAAIGLFPNLLISTLDPAYSQTIFNAASEPNTLTVMLVIAVIGMPFVVLYTAGVYYIFRGRVQLGPSSY